MRKAWTIAMLLGCWSSWGMAQTSEELVNDGLDTVNVLTQSMGYDRNTD